ncbi:MAG: MTAP family purine nucleoside phosphorylase [Thermoplasmatales archaeon]|nr:MTAP family purine nucleoside phosphorylase [Thermoplasmatales archaeon]
MKIGIIGGTGFYEMEGEEIEIETSYGSISSFLLEKNGKRVLFIPRHGKNHRPAHTVNYHANIQAMKNFGAEAIIGISNVGSMKKEIKRGEIFIPDDFIDLSGRKCTFYDERAIHIDMSNPFCPVLRKIIVEEARKRERYHEGVYIVTNGPRLETKAEINFFRNFADVVGMTLMPELALAREMGICYASICLVSNYAVGMQEKLSAREIKEMVNEKKKIIIEIVDDCIKRIPEKRICECRKAIEEGKI